MTRRTRLSALLVAIASVVLLPGPDIANAAIQSNSVSAEVRERIETDGKARVIVKLRQARQQAISKDSRLAAAPAERVARMRANASRVREQLRGTGYRVRREFASVPYMAIEVDAAGLARLEAMGAEVEGVYPDVLMKPQLGSSVVQIDGDIAQAAGFDGTGSVVVVVDTGVESQHPFLSGKVVAEACFAANETGIGGACPNGQATQLTAGAGEPCPFAALACRHGTHVAGIAAGSGPDFTGVAPGADIISIQVFHTSGICEGSPYCALAYTSDITAALEHVYTIRDQYPIASVNLSLGAGSYTEACDDTFPSMRDAIDNLKAAGIATVAASGNAGTANAIISPACISSAISVAAVDDDDRVASFSAVSTDLDLFAPGVGIESSIPGAAYALFSGTSMATPHVAGAIAAMQQHNPTATVDERLATLESSGKPILDVRNDITRPRIRVAGAVGIESPLPIATSVVPSVLTAWGPTTAITVHGADFTRASSVLINGANIASTFVDDTMMSADLPLEMLQTTAAALDVQVSSPAPGGGVSAVVPLSLVQPSLAASVTSAFPGDTIDVTLTNAPGREFDWLVLASTSAAPETYVDWTYIPAGVSSFDWSVTAPAVLDTYEVRLFSNGSYSVITTTESISVESPAPELHALSETRVAANSGNLTMTLSGANFIPESRALVDGVARPTTYVSDTRLIVDIPASDIATTASALAISVYSPPPGGGTSAALTLAIAHPTLTVSSTAVAAGDAVTVNLNDGLGGSADWLVLARVGDSDGTYLQWTYVGAGSFSTTWTVTMPSAPGDYEFRLFAGSGERLATSPAVTVGSEPP
ncbi:MAG: S8 family serine peptidase, partial [Woeseiaceae bacterium]|nr:S8 family serine peptidase [Woeseiaceae bacterium]